jgi:molecular chaperone GrpE
VQLPSAGPAIGPPTIAAGCLPPVLAFWKPAWCSGRPGPAARRSNHSATISGHLTDTDTRPSTAAALGSGPCPKIHRHEHSRPKPSTALEREHAEMKDRLRTLAEMENANGPNAGFRCPDVQYLGLRRDILSVADNVHRRCKRSKRRATADSGLKALLDGVELTERELMNALEKHGVTRIDPLGQKFDPNRHQAMYEVEDQGVPSGSVVQVVQAGYLIGDRVLRPAMVAVSKGGPKAQPAPAEPPANDNSGAK